MHAMDPERWVLRGLTLGPYQGVVRGIDPDPAFEQTLLVTHGDNIDCVCQSTVQQRSAGRLEFVPGSPAVSVDRIAALQPYFAGVLPDLADPEFLYLPVQPTLGSDPPAALAMTLAWLTAQLQNLGNGCVSEFALARTADGEVLALSGYQVPEVAVQAMQMAWALIAAGG